MLTARPRQTGLFCGTSRSIVAVPRSCATSHRLSARGPNPSHPLALFAITNRRLIAVMAVGYEDRVRSHESLHAATQFVAGQRPEPAGNAQVVHGLKGRATAGGLLGPVLG